MSTTFNNEKIDACSTYRDIISAKFSVADTTFETCSVTGDTSDNNRWIALVYAMVPVFNVNTEACNVLRNTLESREFFIPNLHLTHPHQ